MFHHLSTAPQHAGRTAPLPPARDPLPLDINDDPDFKNWHAIGRHGNYLLDAGNQEAFVAFYQAQKGDGRTLLLEACAKNLAHSEMFELWARQSPKNAVVQLFAGANLSHRAWEARGGKLASNVGGGQWEVFLLWLSAAYRHLQASIELDPSDAEPYHRTMRVLIGDSSLSDKFIEDYFAETVKRRPDHLLAHQDMLTRLTEKWGGSHDMMFDFANRITNAAPVGSLLHTLTPMAIIERMVYYTINGDYDGGNQYLKSPEVRDKLAASYAKSVDSSKLQQTPLTPILFNWMAAALIYSNVKVGRKECLDKMGDRVTDRPWAYISMPVFGIVNELRGDFGLPPL